MNSPLAVVNLQATVIAGVPTGRPTTCVHHTEREEDMEDHLAIVFYIAIPVVILVSVFVYYFTKREEDIEHSSQHQVPPPEQTDEERGA